MKHLLSFVIGFVGCLFSVVGQHVFLVTLTAKDSSYSVNRPQDFLSEKAIARRQKFSISITENDFPVSDSVLQAFRLRGYEILAKSKWLNAVAIKAPSKREDDVLRQLRGVAAVKYLGENKPIRKQSQSPIDINEMLQVLDAKVETKQHLADTNPYGKAWNQVQLLQVHKLHQLGFNGKNICVAVLDAGFKNANRLSIFKSLFEENRVLATVDFVQKDSMVFEDDDHGMAVLSCMAGSQKGEFVGTAPQASYVLLRSEYALTEMPIEEMYWAEAIEYADSLGADIVNSSLGYNEFDDADFNYSYKELTGKKAIVSRAASLAVSKGMVVVVSAGNEGDEEWRYVSVPADAAEVITVGGVSPEGYHAAFSSVGPTSDKRIKPDLAAQGDNVWVASSHGVLYQGDGTSYACPLLTGAIACLLQAHPDKTPLEIMNALHQSGNRYDKPDIYTGYGIPDVELAHQLLLADDNQLVSLRDARFLGDKKIHIVVSVSQPAKVTVHIRNDLNQQVMQEEVMLKRKGTYRLSLKKTKKLPKGTYSLQLQTSENINTQTIILQR